MSTQIAAAETALEKRDYAGAEALLKQILAQRPKDAHVLYDLGFAQERVNEEADAAKSYAAALAADPAMAEAALALGLLHARTGKMAEAHGELAAVGTMSSAAPALRARALRALATMDSVEHPSDASAELLQAIKLTGETAEDTQLAASLAMNGGDSGAAEQAYIKALEANPDDVQARVGLAAALRNEGKLLDAESTLLTGLKAHPDDVQINAMLADVYVRENKDKDAIPLIEGLRARDASVKSNVAITELLARIYSMNNRPADAEVLLREVAGVKGDDPRVLDELGSTLVKEAKYAEAVRVLATAVSKREAFHDDKAWAEAASHLAFAASRAKQPELVLQALAARATVLPNSPASLFLAATANDSLHKFKDASRLYREFLSVAGGKFPDEEFEARHRLVALQHEK